MIRRIGLWFTCGLVMTLIACAKAEVKNEYYPDGKLMAEKTVNGKHATTKAYLPNGTLIGEYHYKNGKQHGTTRIYYNDGTIFQIIEYRQGEIKSKLQFEAEKSRQ